MNEILNDLVQQAGNSAIKLVQLIEEQAPLLVHDLLVVRGIEQTAGLLAGLAIVGVAIVLAARSRKISQRLRLDSVDQLFFPCGGGARLHLCRQAAQHNLCTQGSAV